MLVECILPIFLLFGFIVHQDSQCLIVRSVDRMASVTYTMKNGVKQVDWFRVILKPRA
jgi:hypothetical protein